jgi:hypothetical protein
MSMVGCELTGKSGKRGMGEEEEILVVGRI